MQAAPYRLSVDEIPTKPVAEGMKKPAATSLSTQRSMSANRSRDTGPERALRSAIHRRGLRFRLQTQPLPGSSQKADLVFRPARVAVFVDGCFWHSCPVHGTRPRANAEWWREKLDRVVAKDRETDKTLREADWASVRVWEHEDPEGAADRVERLVRARLDRFQSAAVLEKSSSHD
jgi:DNA mismatch endonuclease (patch repair protein)